MRMSLRENQKKRDFRHVYWRLNRFCFRFSKCWAAQYSQAGSNFLHDGTDMSDLHSFTGNPCLVLKT